MMYFSICFLSFLGLMFFSLLMLIFGMVFILFDSSVFVEWEIFNFNGSMIVMTLLFDWMSLLFMSLVLFISSLVLYYSYDYMFNDSSLNRFIIMVLLFVFSMMFLILSPNLISILLGWDGLGLVSYCLVIYYQNVKSYNAGMLTVLSNRLGDVAILISIAWMLNYGSWNFTFYDYFLMPVEMHMISFLLVIASMTKSAQIPFSSWLPAAMAAPTPVSALVHSSTLVTAGVYLMIRFNSMLLSSGFNTFLLIVGCLTMFMAGIGANYEYDLKKIIALSTLSQLGLMMSTLSLGYYNLSYFHMLTHALFKALLFLCAGSYIHSLMDCQDIRCMGSLIYFMPFTSVCFNVSNLSLCGMPFLSGFYSKDLILEIISMEFLNVFIYLLYFISTGLTAMYTFRLFYYSMFMPYNYSVNSMFFDHNFYMNFGMLGLLFMSVLGGSLLNWLIFFSFDEIILPSFMKYMTMFVVMVGSYLGYVIFSYSSMSRYLFNIKLIFFFGSMWFMPFLSTNFLVYYPLEVGLFNILMDMGWLELLGGQGLYSLFIYLINYFQFWYDSSFSSYLLLFIFWMLILFGLMYI